MSQHLKITLLVITGFISFTALMSSVMMLSVKHYAPFQTALTATFFISIAITVFVVTQIIKLNKAWKTQQLEKAVEAWAEWTVEGTEWEKYKALYASENNTKKDTLTYSLTGTVIWFLFILLVVTAAHSFTAALITALASSPVFCSALYLMIFKISTHKVSHLTNASKAEIKGFGELLLVNGKAIFLNTPGLKPCTLKIEEKDGVFSAVLILESVSPRRRITQQHRIPFPASKADIAHSYFEKIRKTYNF